MFVKFNKLLYKITFHLYGYEGIKISIIHDTRNKSLILNDLFHLIDNLNPTEKNIFINKIKNKELVIPIIDNNFINIINKVDKFRQKIIKLLEKNDTSKLITYFVKHNLVLSYINNENFDLLIYAIQNDISISMIRTIISLYKSLNYSTLNKNNEHLATTSALNSLIENSIDILTNDNNSFSLRLLYLNDILNEYENTNEKSYYYTPLYYAISNNKFSIAKELIEHGASMNFKVNQKDLLYSIIKQKEWNKLNLKFIFNNSSFYNTPKFITLLSNLIKEKDDLHDYFDIILPFYDNNISFILKLLSIYKNNIILSKSQLRTVLSSENSTLPVEWLFQAIDTDKYDVVVSLIHNRADLNKKASNGDSPLLRALKINSMRKYEENEDYIDNNNIKIVSYLIKNYADVNEIIENGDNLLIYAIRRNNTVIVKNLISNGADIFYQKCDSSGDNPLTVAVKCGRDKIIKYIIEYSSINLRKDSLLQDSNLINLSIENCNESMTNYLIEKGITVDNKVCLANAIYMDYSDTTLKYLIEHGADINQKGKCNKTPLYIAIENKNEDLIKYLIDHKVTIDDSSILPVAVKNDISMATIQYLIDHNIKIIKHTYNKDTSPLIEAIQKNDESLVKYLIDNGIEINFNDNTSHDSPLSLAFKKRNENIIKYLIEHGADIKAKLGDETPLTYTIENYPEPLVKYIIDKGADVNCKNNDNHTPLFYAINNCNETIVKYLIDHGATDFSDIDLKKAFYKKWSESLIQYFIDHCVSLEKDKTVFDEPLLIAIENNYSISLIKSMIDHGANINFEKDGNTPLKVAIKKRNSNLVEYLLNNGAKVDGLKRIQERPFITKMNKNTTKIKNFIMKHSIDNGDNNNNKKKRRTKKSNSSSSSSSPLTTLTSLSDKYDNNLSEILFQFVINQKKRKRNSNKDDNNNDDDLIEIIPDRKKRKKCLNAINYNHYLTEAIENNYGEILIRSLLDHGVNVDQDFSLIKALENNYSETIIQLLLEHGANVNKKDEKGRTPLTLALTHSSEIMIKMLIDHGAEINEPRENGEYPLNLSIKNGNESLVQYLIDHGAKVEKSTPLLSAIEKRFNEKVILYLIEHNADFQPDKLLNVALEQNYSNVVLKSLIDHGANMRCDDGFKKDLSEDHYYYGVFRNNRKKSENSGIMLLANLIERNNEELIRYVIEHGLNKIHHLYSVLCFSLNKRSSMNLIQFIMKHYNNTDKMDGENCSSSNIDFPLIRDKDFSLIKYLNEQNFNIYNHHLYYSETISSLSENIIKYINHHNPLFIYNRDNFLIHCYNQGKEEMVKYFFNHKIMDNNNEELLKIAIKNEDQDFVDYLLVHRVPVDAKSLKRAIKRGNLNIVKTLTDYGIDINNSRNILNDRPLVLAINYEQLEIVKFFVEHGVDVRVRDQFGNTLLKLVMDLKNVDILNYLIHQDIEFKINEEGHTPLTYAIKTGNLEIVQCLIDDNYHPDHDMYMFINIGNNKITPLNMAIQLGHFEMVKYLVERGADINQKSGNTIYTNPLIYAIKYSNAKILNYLIKEGEATLYGLDQMVGLLSYAIENSTFEIVKCLVEHQVDIDRRNNNDWMTPLMMTLRASSLNVELIKFLIDHGADVHAVDDNNETPLIQIIKYSTKKSNERNGVIKYLIDHGADLSKKDSNGKSILELAQQYCTKTLIDYMIEKGAKI